MDGGRHEHPPADAGAATRATDTTINSTSDANEMIPGRSLLLALKLNDALLSFRLQTILGVWE